LVFVIISLYIESLIGLGTNYELVFRNSAFPVLAVVALFIVWKFSKAVEDVAFRKKIPVSKLKVGDMLASSKELEGITGSEISKIKRSGKKTIWIREGVRFAPAFPIAFLFTLYFGDALFLLIKYLI
jgi:prepilin signal peptidase PulO-like enzyme (type II secretory pathway)